MDSPVTPCSDNSMSNPPWTMDDVWTNSGLFYPWKHIIIDKKKKKQCHKNMSGKDLIYFLSRPVTGVHCCSSGFIFFRTPSDLYTTLDVLVFILVSCSLTSGVTPSFAYLATSMSPAMYPGQKPQQQSVTP